MLLTRVVLHYCNGYIVVETNITSVNNLAQNVFLKKIITICVVHYLAFEAHALFVYFKLLDIERPYGLFVYI